MNLIDDWKSCLRLFSVQANTIGLAMTAAYSAMYEQLKDNFPPKIMAAVTAAVFVLGIVGRLVSQTPKDDPK